ncbi:MAG: VTT domain-containing protein [Pseudolabrys sp.]|nr:VTT domain-containing protein [Pseudolabrys sp.]
MELPGTDALLELIRSGQAFSQYGVLVLVLACLLSAFVVMPRAVFCTGAGFFYGVSVIPFLAGALTAGAVVAFWIARYLARDTIERKLEKRPTARAIRQAVDEEGWRIVTLLRIAAPAPFSTVSYIFGVSGVGALPFAAGTLAGILPSLTLYTYLGSLGNLASAGALENSYRPLLLVAGALVLGLTVLLIARRVRQVLRRMQIEA